MKVNDVSISYSLVHYEVKPSDITNNYFQAINSLPIYFSKEIGTKELKIELLFSGTTRQEAEKKISDFMALVSGQSTIRLFDTDTYFYDCIFNKIEEVNKDNIYNQLVTFSFVAIQKQDMQTLTLKKTATQNISILGNIETPCVYEITAPLAVTNVKINDITISSIPAGKKVIIDGIKKLVTQDSLNVFNNVEMINFPKLKPGSNTITLSDTTISVVVKYYPMFI